METESVFLKEKHSQVNSPKSIQNPWRIDPFPDKLDPDLMPIKTYSLTETSHQICKPHAITAIHRVLYSPFIVLCHRRVSEYLYY